MYEYIKYPTFLQKGDAEKRPLSNLDISNIISWLLSNKTLKYWCLPLQKLGVIVGFRYQHFKDFEILGMRYIRIH